MRSTRIHHEIKETVKLQNMAWDFMMFFIKSCLRFASRTCGWSSPGKAISAILERSTKKSWIFSVLSLFLDAISVIYLSVLLAWYPSAFFKRSTISLNGRLWSRCLEIPRKALSSKCETTRLGSISSGTLRDWQYEWNRCKKMCKSEPCWMVAGFWCIELVPF